MEAAIYSEQDSESINLSRITMEAVPQVEGDPKVVFALIEEVGCPLQ
jgi:hypothetical protein